MTAATSYGFAVTINTIRDGRFVWGWTVESGSDVVACDVLPRFSEKSARRRAEKAARRWARNGRPPSRGSYRISV